jgi:hypothetical protein
VGLGTEAEAGDVRNDAVRSFGRGESSAGPGSRVPQVLAPLTADFSQNGEGDTTDGV